MKEPGWSIYPNLETWIFINCTSVSDFARKAGVSKYAVLNLMEGRGGTTKYVIDQILKKTGMTYETAFRQIEKTEK